MSTLLNIRGTNGAGKTTYVRQLMAALAEPNPFPPAQRVLPPEFDKVWTHELPGQAIVLGKYDGATCGGCDGIKTQDLICNTLRWAVQRAPLVVFEGVLVSGLYTRYAELDDELTAQGHRFLWAFLTTSLDESVARMNTRRAAKGKGPLEDIGNVEAKFKAMKTCRTKALAAGRKVVHLTDFPADRALLRELEVLAV